MQKFGVSVPMLVILLVCMGHAHAQEQRTEMDIYFRVNRTVIDTAYMDNAARIQKIITTLRNIRQDSALSILEVSFCGAASPEGSYQLNRKLASGRLSSLESIVRREIDIPDSLITHNDSYIPWNYLKSQVERSSLRRRDEILAIIDEEPCLVKYRYPDRLVDHRIVKLKQLDDYQVWWQLYHMYFKHMRNAYVVVVAYRENRKVTPPVQRPGADIMRSAQIELPIPELKAPAIALPTQQSRFFAVKTNLIFAAALCANLGFEVELWPKWSLDIPVWYSPYDITSTRKLRLLATQPEIRWWPKKAGEGHFFGLHTHIAGFNVAINDNGRYQDPNHALWGMGVSYGFATHLDRDKRWGMEFNIGAGFAQYDYDCYYNRPNGQKFRSESARYFGVTRIGATLSYKFYKQRKNRRWMKW